MGALRRGQVRCGIRECRDLRPFSRASNGRYIIRSQRCSLQTLLRIHSVSQAQRCSHWTCWAGNVSLVEHS